jgi:DNA-binding winged helix-turn-helix (wHTH) protein
VDAEPKSARLFRFGVFEADADTGELRRQGVRLRLHAQAFQTLLMLLETPGELVTREALQQRLWPEGTFVDFEHGVNSAVNRLREALGDSARNPRYIETLARRGYRFIAPVETPGRRPQPAAPQAAPAEATPEVAASTLLASPEELPRAPWKLVRTLFLLMQAMYLAFYVGALANLPEIHELLADFSGRANGLLGTLIATACILIPVRLFMISAALFTAPVLWAKYSRLFPAVLVMDLLWSLAPFLLLHHIAAGLALCATAALVYSPFAQRSLMLMMVRPPAAR